MTKSDWADWRHQIDALQEALHALVTEAITEVVSTRDVITSLQAVTDYLKRKELNDAR